MKLLELFVYGPEAQSGGVANLVVTLFAARDIGHKLHLLTSSFAQHIALEEFYTGIVDLADEMAEVCQGRHGALLTDMLNCQPDVKFTCDPITFARELDRYLQTLGRSRVGSDSTLQNILDEIIALASRMKYKLENLVN